MMKGERQMKLLKAVQIADFLGISQEEVLRHAGDSGAPAPAGGVIVKTLTVDRVVQADGSYTTILHIERPCHGNGGSSAAAASSISPIRSAPMRCWQRCGAELRSASTAARPLL
jgi:hypothetical protein